MTGNPGQTVGMVFGSLQFGTHPAIRTGSQNTLLGSTGSSQAMLQCSANTTMQLSLDGGQSPVAAQRRLSNGRGSFIPYTLALTTLSNVLLQPNVPVGVIMGSTPQMLPLQATVTLPGQGLPAGTYSDTVQVTLSW